MSQSTDVHSLLERISAAITKLESRLERREQLLDWQQPYQLGVPLLEEPTPHNQPLYTAHHQQQNPIYAYGPPTYQNADPFQQQRNPYRDTQPWQQPPDPPDWQRHPQQPPYGFSYFGTTDLVANGDAVTASFGVEHYTAPMYRPPPGYPPFQTYGLRVGEIRQPTAPEPEMQPELYHIYPSPPPAPMPEPYHRYPSLTPEPDDPYSHYQPSEELYPPVYNGEGYSSNSFNYSVDDYLSYTDSWQPENHPSSSLPPPDRTLHPPSWLPSYCSPAAAAVRQPPQLRSSSSWVDMPRQHVQNSVPTFTASTISLTATTQDRSFHEHPVVVRQPLLPPTSPCCSAVTPSAAAAVPVLLKGDPYLSGEEVAGVIVASPQKELARNIDEFLEFVVREHIGERGEGEKDLVDVLLEVPRNERVGFVLDDIYIKALILDMFAAGSDTTFTLMEWTLSELIRHKKAKNELFFMVDVLTLRQLCASRGHLHTFDPGGDTSPRILFVTLFVLSWFPP